MGEEKTKGIPAGIKAIIAWSLAYTVIVVAACIYFWDVRARGYGGIVPDSLIGVTYGERAVFYAICFGGWVVNVPIVVKIRGLIEKTDGYRWKEKQKRQCVFDIPFLIVAVILLVVCWQRAISFLVISGLYMLGNVERLWIYRKELGLAE